MLTVPGVSHYSESNLNIIRWVGSESHRRPKRRDKDGPSSARSSFSGLVNGDGEIGLADANLGQR
jgi:hypothetical protein